MVVCLGQLIVDLVSTEAGVPLRAATRFERHPGGSAANVAVGLHHHGVPVRLWSRVGDDGGGRFALAALAAHGLDTAEIARDPERPTRFTRIGVDERGAPAMEIHNVRSADQAFTAADVPPGGLDGARLLYVGGTMLLGGTSSEAARELMQEAHARGLVVALDPNIRPSRTPHPERVRACLDAVLPFVDVLQTSRPAWADLWGDRAPQALLRAGPSLVARTEGAAGASLHTRHHTVEVPAEPVEVVDATGAGDAFLAALLARVAALPPGQPVADVPAEVLWAWGRFAAAWAGRAARPRGAVTAYRRPG